MIDDKLIKKLKEIQERLNIDPSLREKLENPSWFEKAQAIAELHKNAIEKSNMGTNPAIEKIFNDPSFRNDLERVSKTINEQPDIRDAIGALQVKGSFRNPILTDSLYAVARSAKLNNLVATSVQPKIFEFKNTIAGSILSNTKAVDNIATAIASKSAILKSFESLSASLSSAIGTTSVMPLTPSIKTLLIGATPISSYISENFDKFVKDADTLKEFEKSFASDYVEMVGRLTLEEEEENKEEIVEEFIEKTSTKLTGKGLHPIFVTYAYPIIIMVLFYYLFTLPEQQASEDRLIENQNNNSIEIREDLKNYIDKKAKEIQDKCVAEKTGIGDLEEYGVISTTEVHDSPDQNSRVNAILQSNMTVLVVDKEPDWAYVHYLDFVNLAERVGWVRIEHLLKKD